MRGGGPQRILLPVRVSFMALSMIIALAFNYLPWPDSRFVPDLLALTLTFWCIHQPRKVNVGVCWLFGLMMDTVNGALMGQHALAYSLLGFGAHIIHRRVLWFPLWQQALHVLVLLLISQLTMVAVRMIAGGTYPGTLMFLSSFVSAALWPIATSLLLAPQRLPTTRDETRPI